MHKIKIRGVTIKDIYQTGSQVKTKAAEGIVNLNARDKSGRTANGEHESSPVTKTTLHSQLKTVTHSEM